LLSGEVELAPIVLAVSAAATALSTWLLARLAQRSGWVDDGAEARERKLQSRPVAPVGGAAILCGCALSALVAHGTGGDALSWIRIPGGERGDPSHASAQRVWILAAILAAFAVGLCDDLAPRGLSALRKLGGQTLVGILLGIAFGISGAEIHWGAFGLGLFGAIVAQNAVNTFDNADGAAAATGVLGFSAAAPVIAAALAGFLPFNLWLRRGAAIGRSAASDPIAYLGDSGSHVLGVLLLLNPQAGLALTLPLLDLARVALVRIQSGIAPWIGDRRHLAHRMLDRGWTPTGTVLALCAIAAPSVAAGTLAREDGERVAFLAVGVLLTSILFFAALRLCPARE
jgi:UDP-N-acetylmuramyl pentapeptide phosphotransferase/UDP-N-acetylglucosamine-1-phosphate transferase